MQVDKVAKINNKVNNNQNFKQNWYSMFECLCGSY